MRDGRDGSEDSLRFMDTGPVVRLDALEVQKNRFRGRDVTLLERLLDILDGCLYYLECRLCRCVTLKITRGSISTTVRISLLGVYLSDELAFCRILNMLFAPRS
jgi:hypothetical protein